MIKTIVFGHIERYSTENFSHSFEVSEYRGYGKGLDYKQYVCEAIWNNRVITSAVADSRIEAVKKAFNQLQETAYRLPFADYRMSDILTGQC